MTLLTYQVFETVTEQGSFRKAADLLGLTPSAVSHAVSSLEAELGFCVLNRAKSGCDAYQLWRAASSLCKCSFEQR